MPVLPLYIPVCRLLSCSLLLGNTLFEATIPLSVTFIMSQFGVLTKMKSYDIRSVVTSVFPVNMIVVINWLSPINNPALGGN